MASGSDSSGERRDQADHRLPVATQQPEDAGLAAGIERLAEHLVLVEARASARRDRDGRDEEGRRILGRALVALGDGLAGGETGRIGVGGRDPGRVGLEPEPLEGRADLACRGVLAVCGRLRFAGFVVDPVDLGQPIARGGFELIGAARRRDRRPEPALRRVLGVMHGTRIGSPGGSDRGGLVFVVAPLGHAQGIGRGLRLGADPGRQLAALLGQPSLLGTPVRGFRIAGWGIGAATAG